MEHGQRSLTGAEYSIGRNAADQSKQTIPPADETSYATRSQCRNSLHHTLAQLISNRCYYYYYYVFLLPATRWGMPIQAFIHSFIHHVSHHIHIDFFCFVSFFIILSQERAIQHPICRIAFHFIHSFTSTPKGEAYWR